MPRAPRAGARPHDRGVERVEAVPGDRRLERLRQHAHGHEHVAQVGGAQERVAPAARPRRSPARPLAAPLGDASPPCSAHSSSARAIAALDRVVGRLEAEHEQRRRAVAGEREARLLGVDAAGSWPGADRTAPAPARAAAPAANVANATPAERAVRGRGCTRTQASVMTPSVPSEPTSIRSGLEAGAGAGQPPRLPHAGRRERPHRLDEVVDVGLQRGEVAARARGDPAAERRELERLREVAQREPVPAQLVLERRTGARRPGCGPSARPGRPRARGRARRRSMRHTPVKPSAERRLDAADDARAAAERDRRRALGPAPSRAPPRRRPRRAGGRRRRVGGRSCPRKPRTTSR